MRRTDDECMVWTVEGVKKDNWQRFNQSPDNHREMRTLINYSFYKTYYPPPPSSFPLSANIVTNYIIQLYNKNVISIPYKLKLYEENLKVLPD